MARPRNPYKVDRGAQCSRVFKLALFLAERPHTAAEIMSHIDIARRNVDRYLRTLENAGVPVKSSPAPDRSINGRALVYSIERDFLSRYF